MIRPPLEVADLVRAAGTAFIERNRQWIGWPHIKVLLAIARCRTAALGGHIAARPHGSHALSLLGASDSALGFLANFVLADHRSTIIGRISERLLFLDDKQPIHAKRCFHQVKPKEVVREG